MNEVETEPLTEPEKKSEKKKGGPLGTILAIIFIAIVVVGFPYLVFNWDMFKNNVDELYTKVTGKFFNVSGPTSDEVIKKRIEKYGTVIESWYPIGHGDKNLINEPLFTKLGQKYGKTNVQIILRWHIQEGTIVFPRSTNPVHIKENFEIFDFELTEEEIKEIDSLDWKQKRIQDSEEELLKEFAQIPDPID